MAKRRTAKQAEMERAIKKANELFITFHGREPDLDKLVALKWPASGRFGVVDTISITSYLSNKWERDWTPYKHEHLAPFPVLLEPYRPGMRPWGHKYRRPLALSWFGYALDLQVVEDGAPEYIDYKHMEELPFLAGDPQRNMLVIIDQDTDKIQLLWSPILEVTERGIEN